MTAIGSDFHLTTANSVHAFLIRQLGTADLHSHYRLRLFKRWLHRHADTLAGKTVCEIGCGDGLNLFEARRVAPMARFVGFDFDRVAIDKAERLSQRMAATNLSFHVADATSTSFDERIDVLLLMDVLEHIDDPLEFLSSIRSRLHSRSKVLVSVPTPRYPVVFGRAFHERVGHVVDGYTADSLQALLANAGYSVTGVSYNTGAVASLFCYVFYNLLGGISWRAKVMLGFLLAPVRHMDVLATSTQSCSLFVEARPR